MTRFSSRPYTAADLPAIIDFASRLTAQRLPGLTRWNPGDLVWQLGGFPPGFDFASTVRLWHDERGVVVALAIFEPPLNFEFDIDPEIVEAGLGDAILSFVEEQRAALRGHEGTIPQAYAMLGDDALATSLRDSDTATIEFLSANGFRRVERHSVRYSRSLAEPIPPPLVPSGVRVRGVFEAEVEARAELHRDAWSVWGPSKFSAASYRRMRACPLYDATLDIVAEDETGRLLSYCIAWFDGANGIGHFEPVGTRPEATNRGLARAVVVEGLRRLRERGAHTALIGTASVNAAALRTYLACGFEFVEREHFYVRAMG